MTTLRKHHGADCNCPPCDGIETVTRRSISAEQLRRAAELRTTAFVRNDRRFLGVARAAVRYAAAMRAQSA